MADCCDEHGCTRKQPLLLRGGLLPDCWYVVTRYRQRDKGLIESQQKHQLDTETCTTLTRWQEAVNVLAELVRLKDGPRDDTYWLTKDAAWERARRVMRGYEQLADTEGDRVEAVRIPTRAEVMAALTHDGWCDLQIHAACCGKRECNCAVADLVDQMVARGWRPPAGEAAL